MTSALSIFDDVREANGSLSFKIRRRLFLMTSYLAALLASFMSTFGRRSLVGGADAPVVSLTSYGPRVQRVSATIESIGRGALRPSRIVLWIDDQDIYSQLPQGLKRQTARGLEVKLTENLGPHTKYYPLIADESDQVTSFATADDDIIYPAWWLQRLVSAAVQTPGQVVCHRAHRVKLHGTSIAPYRDWTSVRDPRDHPSVFATGVSGVLYPREMVTALRSAGRGFEPDCRSADDIWLHRVALDHAIPVRQISDTPKHFWITPDSQSETLMQSNLAGSNDRSIAALYDERHIRAMERRSVERQGGEPRVQFRGNTRPVRSWLRRKAPRHRHESAIKS